MITSDRTFYFGLKGQRLFVREWGSPQKPTLLLIHGAPGCADHGKLMSGSPLWNQFRLLAIDRPGYGKSDAQKSLTPLLLAAQIEKLLAFRKIKKLSILSVSGGAPYSMALAYLLGPRVQKLSSIGGIAPLTPLNFFFMNPRQKKTWALRKFLPRPFLDFAVTQVWRKRQEKMEDFFFTELDSFSEPDQKVLGHPQLGPVLLDTMKEALQSGPKGVLTDMSVYANPWGFPLKDVQCPVTLWHGLADDVVHYRFAQDMSYRLPNAKRQFFKNEGHYSILLNQRDAILQDLLNSNSKS